jgi:hypothetical protein
MQTYKLTYDVGLKPAPGGFCTPPLEILRQMDDAQRKALHDLRGFLKAEGIEKDVSAISPLNGEVGIVICCSADTARRIAAQPFVHDLLPYTPPPEKPATFPGFKFKF